ncbi:excalibur calcium-binding domain-containing protein [Aureimonas glaciei]|uniref:Excalibur calcium-binding domain-containing protein n=1 Tax=Aureimonas glaciei TaxID=1776957 RepID=A0A916XXP8_9HYPH|nr:excalibur calcium-binding domain-containing protein [Aureimonas glaciei]GGD19918.1 hypothetical protein GCM10011335_23530 [Aureimonas glaciei]
MLRTMMMALAVLAALPAAAEVGGAGQTGWERLEGLQFAQARSCKAVNSCEEAVRMWCGGYKRADADKDGIPCENVCSSKSEVDDIKAQIGC